MLCDGRTVVEIIGRNAYATTKNNKKGKRHPYSLKCSHARLISQKQYGVQQVLFWYYSGCQILGNIFSWVTFWTVLQCITQFYTVSHCITLYCSGLKCITLNNHVLLCATLCHCTVLSNLYYLSGKRGMTRGLGAMY
jgi:hypothetical protein